MHNCLVTIFINVKISLAAVGISINLNELKSMGYKPFVVELIAAVTDKRLYNNKEYKINNEN